MLSPEEHAQRLRRFEVDRLIKLVELEALQHHHGHWGLFRFSNHYKVAFDTPEMTGYKHDKSYHQLARMPSFSTLKEALIHALVTGKTFTDYFDGDPQEEWMRGEREFREQLYEQFGVTDEEYASLNTLTIGHALTDREQYVLDALFAKLGEDACQDTPHA